MRDPDALRGYSYELFGLQVRSELALPELIEAEDGAEADVAIRMGQVDAPAGDDAGLYPHDGAFVLVVPDVARFRIEQGRTITIEPAPGAPEPNVRLFLLGSAFGALLHQKGLLPLHANAVEIDGRAFAFVGRSGEGKSTLAAWFHDQGYRVIADDVCVVGFDEEGVPYAMPGLPRLRLWREALEATGRDADSYARSYAGREDFDKFDVPLSVRGIAGERLALAAIYLLERGEGVEISPIKGIAAAETIFANTYRGRYVSFLGSAQPHYQACLELVRKTPLFALRRSWNLERLGAEASEIVAHAKNHSASWNARGAKGEVGR